MNMTSAKTISKIGLNEDNIKNHDQERVYFTAIL